MKLRTDRDRESAGGGAAAGATRRHASRTLVSNLQFDLQFFTLVDGEYDPLGVRTSLLLLFAVLVIGDTCLLPRHCATCTALAARHRSSRRLSRIRKLTHKRASQLLTEVDFVSL